MAHAILLTDTDADPYRVLAGAIVRRALIDLRSRYIGRRRAAMRFMRSRWACCILDALSVDRAWVLDRYHCRRTDERRMARLWRKERCYTL